MNGKGTWFQSSTHYHQSTTNSSELFKSFFERSLCQKHFRNGARWRHVLLRDRTYSNWKWSLWRYMSYWKFMFFHCYLSLPGGEKLCRLTVFVLYFLFIFFHLVNFCVANRSHGKDNCKKDCSMAKHARTHIKSGCHLKGAHGERPEDY